MPIIKVIIPAYNEEESIGKVIREIPDIVDEIIVVNNNSTDHTDIIAKKAGATVLNEPRKGYGYACLKGMDYLANQEIKPEIVVFLDGDFSDYPEELVNIVKPIIEEDIDFVIGARVKYLREDHSMTPQQIFGNWLATRLMLWFYGVKFTDLGPFRAIRFSPLLELDMQDKTFGWTVEMQLKAAKHKLRCVEVPVRYRKRIGFSKISGTVKGTVMAGYKILYTIFRYL